MRRCLPAAVAAAAVLLLAFAPSRASADTSVTLLQAIQRADKLAAQVQGDRAAVTAQKAVVARTARRLQRAADRIARLEMALSGLQAASLGVGSTFADQIHAWLSGSAAVAAAERRLAAEQRRAEFEKALPRLAVLQRRLDRSAAERRRELALVDALRGEPPATATGAVSREAWATALLGRLQAPVCANNLVSLVTWQTAENTTAAWNPLATTMPALGATGYNSVGVENYPDMGAGLDATVATLQSGYRTQGYGWWIIYRLQQCADPTVTTTAINASNWCRGCAGGAYVTGLLPAVRADYAAYAG